MALWKIVKQVKVWEDELDERLEMTQAAMHVGEAIEIVPLPMEQEVGDHGRIRFFRPYMICVGVPAPQGVVNTEF